MQRADGLSCYRKAHETPGASTHKRRDHIFPDLAAVGQISRILAAVAKDCYGGIVAGNDTHGRCKHHAVRRADMDFCGGVRDTIDEIVGDPAVIHVAGQGNQIAGVLGDVCTVGLAGLRIDFPGIARVRCGGEAEAEHQQQNQRHGRDPFDYHANASFFKVCRYVLIPVHGASIQKLVAVRKLPGRVGPVGIGRIVLIHGSDPGLRIYPVVDGTRERRP